MNRPNSSSNLNSTKNNNNNNPTILEGHWKKMHEAINSPNEKDLSKKDIFSDAHQMQIYKDFLLYRCKKYEHYLETTNELIDKSCSEDDKKILSDLQPILKSMKWIYNILLDHSLPTEENHTIKFKKLCDFCYNTYKKDNQNCNITTKYDPNEIIILFHSDMIANIYSLYKENNFKENYYQDNNNLNKILESGIDITKNIYSVLADSCVDRAIMGIFNKITENNLNKDTKILNQVISENLGRHPNSLNWNHILQQNAIINNSILSALLFNENNNQNVINHNNKPLRRSSEHDDNNEKPLDLTTNKR